MTAFLKALLDKFAGLGLGFKLVLVAFIVGFVLGGCTCRAWRIHVIDQPAPDEDHGMGWLDNPQHVQAVIGTFPRPFFGDAGKQLVQAGEDKDAFLWKAVEKLTGKPWKAHDQDGTGCCVGEGNSAAVEVLSAVDIVVNNRREEWKPISAAACYALARQVGGNLGGGDGSSGVDAAKALQELGAISCEDAHDDNTTGKEHASLAKKWGGRGGLPSDLKAIAAKHKVKTASLVRTPEEARAALVNGYPLACCSSVGFEPFKRDSDGFCRPGGTWPHCMCCAGYRADKRAFLILQSWGESVPPGPTSLGQPPCSFWITWEAMQRILRGGDSYAMSGFDGYPSRQIDVFIREPRKPKDWFALRSVEYALAP
jgi:hypothetical protein